MLNKLLSKLKPTKKEELNFKKIVDEVIKKIKIKDAKVELGGSGAKNTWLKGGHDADIFVKFNFAKHKGKNISKILEKNLRKNFRISVLHGSRDYFQIRRKDFTFEIIPILEINKSSSALNITDISPLHAKWVNKFNFKDDIRLAKAFCKSCGVYGAESYIRGFSGYSLEVLVIHYKGFKNFAKHASKWNRKVVIDPEKHLKKPLEELNKSKIESPLVLVDPVDSSRNVCAALGFEKFDKLRKCCIAYLKKPSEKMFFVTEEKIPCGAVVLNVASLKGKKDIVGSKLLKAFEFIFMKLRNEGYNVVKSGWDFSRFWFLFSEKKLGKYKIQYGPPENMGDNLDKFRRKHKKIYFDGKRSYARVLRKHKDVNNFLRYLIKLDEIKKRVKSIKISKPVK